MYCGAWIAVWVCVLAVQREVEVDLSLEIDTGAKLLEQYDEESSAMSTRQLETC